MFRLLELGAGIGQHLVGRMRALAADLRGATAVEYGLLLAGVAVFIMVTVFAVGDELANLFTAVQTRLTNSFS